MPASERHLARRPPALTASGVAQARSCAQYEPRAVPPNAGGRSFRAGRGVPHWLFFYKLTQPRFVFPPAYEVWRLPARGLVARGSISLRWQVLGAGVLLLLGWSGREPLPLRAPVRPVEKLAVDSGNQPTQRQRAEAALEIDQRGIAACRAFFVRRLAPAQDPGDRASRRPRGIAGAGKTSPDGCQEISALIHQTFRLSSVIEDLLLLSRMDAGRLKLEFGAVNLIAVDSRRALDDLGALPDRLGLAVETDFPTALSFSAGEALHEPHSAEPPRERAQIQPARRPHPDRRQRARAARRSCHDRQYRDADSPWRQAHIFERFHRGAMGEKYPVTARVESRPRARPPASRRSAVGPLGQQVDGI